MLIELPPDDGRPIYLRIASAVAASIEAGDPGVGDRLPPARTLADALDVNMHTVLRAYDELRSRGLVEMRRGRGATVAKQSPKDVVRRAVDELRTSGLTMDAIADLVSTVIEEEKIR